MYNAEEYASDRVEGGVDRITHEVAHQFDKQGRKGLEETKRNVSKAKDGVQKFREKRATSKMPPTHLMWVGGSFLFMGTVLQLNLPQISLNFRLFL